MRCLFPLGILSIACSTNGVAADLDDASCRNGIFAIQNPVLALGKIRPGRSVHFIGDAGACPGPALECRLASRLVAGDRVVIGRARGPYFCVYFPKNGGVAGWLQASRVKRIPIAQNPSASAWLGRWSDHGNPAVSFYRRQGKLMAKGSAAWPEFNPPRDILPGGPHFGEIDEPVRVSGNRAYAPMCQITYTLLGDLLVGADPKMQCGGANVSFSGVYQRARH